MSGEKEHLFSNLSVHPDNASSNQIERGLPQEPCCLSKDSSLGDYLCSAPGKKNFLRHLAIAGPSSRRSLKWRCSGLECCCFQPAYEVSAEMVEPVEPTWSREDLAAIVKDHARSRCGTEQSAAIIPPHYKEYARWAWPLRRRKNSLSSCCRRQVSDASNRSTQVRLTLTHEEIAEIIGRRVKQSTISFQTSKNDDLALKVRPSDSRPPALRKILQS